MDRHPPHGSVVPFVRRGHVIQDLDLIPLIRRHCQRLALCEQAEALADALPDRPDAAAMDRFLAALAMLVTGEAREADDALQAMLLDGRGDLLARTLLDHVRYRQLADVAAARELIAALGEDVDADDAFATPETLGHMLRNFFTGCRRAIDFEQLTILALAEQRLAPAARGVLVDALGDSLLI